jgi:deoxyribonuclease-4
MGELLIGAHLSIAGGIHKAFERGRRLRCRTLQIFLKNSNQWKAKLLMEEDRSLFLEAQKKSGIGPVLAHDSYLINLASPNPALYKKSLEAFSEELNRADFLGVPFLILHPGAHMGAGISAGIARVAAALNLALDSVNASSRILLETTAGQGTGIGHRFEHLASILEKMREPERVGVCLDTCHVFAAGYDIRTREGYEKTLREFDRLVGIGKILAIHLNDSRRELGCRVDRHFHIGKGCIGLEAFRCLVNDRRFAAVPKILETPKGSDTRQDRRNLATLRSLADSRFDVRGSKFKIPD